MTPRRLAVLATLGLALAVAPACKETRETGPAKNAGAMKPFAERAEGRVRVHKAVVAGAFYPADPTQLTSMIKGFLDRASVPEVKDSVFGIIAPHAGYPYSGPVAAYSYKTLIGRKYDAVVVMGPTHYPARSEVVILDVDQVQTPLGTLQVDRAGTQALLAAGDWIKYDPGELGQEHSIEVELPFIQTVLGDVPIVGMAIGNPTPAFCRKLAEVLDRTFRGRNVLFVASSDLSHYHPYDVAGRMDQRLLSLVGKQDQETLAAESKTRQVEACGIGPIQTLLELYRLRGGKDVRVLKYLNSGDTAGDKDRVVGYGAAVFTLPPSGGGAKMPGDYLSAADKKELLTIARRTVEEFVRTKKAPAFTTSSDVLQRDGAAFVTLREKGDLRGCIGHVVAREPLYLCVRDMAVAASSEDPRFPPVRPEELKNIDIEVSVLTPMAPVKDPTTIQVGRDGLMIRKGGRQGLLLPQVPDEFGWDRETFLDQTCRKAGLPAGAWKDKDAEILSFQAIVFQEK